MKPFLFHLVTDREYVKQSFRPLLAVTTSLVLGLVKKDACGTSVQDPREKNLRWFGNLRESGQKQTRQQPMSEQPMSRQLMTGIQIAPTFGYGVAEGSYHHYCHHPRSLQFHGNQRCKHILGDRKTFQLQNRPKSQNMRKMHSVDQAPTEFHPPHLVEELK
jgi:hypothetical protein